MTKRKFTSDLDALEWRLKKLESEYNKTNEKAVLKRRKIEIKAAKVMEKVEILKKSPV